MNILAIGNSFSEDATRYVQQIAASAGKDFYVRNCFIGGCSLERHVNNIHSGEACYAYQCDSQKTGMISLKDALCERKWDYVTIQQVSGFSGLYETYEPFMGELIAYIKEMAPEAEIVFHRTWAYEKDAWHPDFPKYGKDQRKMFNCIVAASNKAASKYGLRIIKSGDAIQAAREHIKTFDYLGGGLSLNRDCFHLTVDYGRYLVGLVWYRFFCGDNFDNVSFAPENTDPAVIAELKNLAMIMA